MSTVVNLIFYDKQNNFGDQLSKFITENIINTHKYKLVYNQPNINLNIICIGSYIHMAKNNCYIFGSGVRTPNKKEGMHTYKNLNVCAVRGPLTKKWLENKHITVPDIYGDPALLLPKFYIPKFKDEIKNKIGIVPHKSQYEKYINKKLTNDFFLINPCDNWKTVIDCICSCKMIISSSLHGLICSDAYKKPNIWLKEYNIYEGDFKFRDYFESQRREYKFTLSLENINYNDFYTEGNKIDVEILQKNFPFN